jgi:prefoldin subunit 5
VINWNWGWLRGTPRVADQQERIAQLEADAVIAERTIESIQRHCDLLADRYDKIRVTNEQLRGALDLYRDDHRRH